MNQYEYYEQHFKQLQLNDAEKDFLDTFKNYVLTHMIDGHLTVHAIANGMAMHEAKLRRRVKQATGFTANGLFTFIRIQQAVTLLADYPSVSISQVAFKCGFADHSHFNHVFHRLTGISPTQYVCQLRDDNHDDTPKTSAT